MSSIETSVTIPLEYILWCTFLLGCSKLLGLITMSWWVVFSPVWLFLPSFVIGAVVVVFLLSLLS